MPVEKSAGAIIFRREPARNASPARQPDGSHGGGHSDAGGGGEIYYLLLHYQSGHWEFPKGHIEKGEREEDTVRREVAEETGIGDIKIMPGFKEWVKYFFRPTYGLSEEEKKKVGLIFKLVTFYLANTETEEIKISPEHKGYKWLSYEEALKQLTFKNAKEILRKANEYVILRKNQQPN